MIGEIENIIPEATYQGEAFTQTVVVRLSDNTRLRVEDPQMKCDQDWIDKSVDVTLSADIAERVELTPECDRTIEVVPVNPETGPGITRLDTNITQVESADGTDIVATLELPTGELTYPFNTDRLPEGLPDGYTPAIGDSLRFENITQLSLEHVADVNE